MKDGIIPDRYGLENLKRVINNPSLLKKEPKTLVSNISLFINKVVFQIGYNTDINIIDKDWDYLIILDACRYDIFSKVNWIDGDLISWISNGSHSVEFAEKNFKNRELYDTVYTTANAHGARIGQDSFHDIIFTERNDTEDWASRNGMHPKLVYESALDSYNKFPNKRHIFHFMQPHSPYFGEKANKLRARCAEEGVNDLGSTQWEEGPNLKLALQEGLISLSEFKEVYIENLEFVLRYIENLCDELDGKIVITADHGELLGDQDGFWKYSDLKRQTPNGVPVGHPKNVYVPELRKVPYLVIDSADRPVIVSENPKENGKIESNKIEDRLRALGYK